MKKKLLLWVIFGITAFVLLIILLTKVVVEPWVGEKIQASLNESSGDYHLKSEKVHVSIFRSGIELKNITLQSKQEYERIPGLTGEIESVKFKGIHLMKAVLRKDITIREVEAYNSRIIGMFTPPEKTGLARLSPLNIRIENLFFDKLEVELKSTSNRQYETALPGIEC